MTSFPPSTATPSARGIVRQTVYNIIDYGADPTGMANSAVAINSAISAANAAGGGVVFAPYGTYILFPTAMPAVGSHGVDHSFCPCILMRSGVTLQGAGVGTILRLVASASVVGQTSPPFFAVITNLNKYSDLPRDHDMVVRDLTVDGNCANNNTGVSGGFLRGNLTEGIQFWYEDHSHYERVTVQDCLGNGDGSSAALADNRQETFAFDLESCTGATYDACWAFNSDPSTVSTSSGFSSAYSTDVAYSDCVAHDMSISMGFTTYESAVVRYSNCWSYSNLVRGFNAELSESVTYGTCVAGARADGAGQSGYSQLQSLGNTGHGFGIAGCQDVSIAGCISRSNGGHGVGVFTHAAGSGVYSGGPVTSSRIRIVGGSLSDNGGQGVSVDPSATNVSVSPSTLMANNAGGPGVITSLLLSETQLFPTLITTHGHAPTNAMAVVAGRYVLVGMSDVSQIGIWDISTGTPVELAFASVAGAPTGMVAWGNYVAISYGTSSGMVAIYDVSALPTLSLVGSVAVGNSPSRMTTRSHYLIVSNNGASTLSIVDVQTPAVPVVTTTYTMGGSAPEGQVWLTNRYLAVACQGGIMYILDMATITSPSVLSSHSIGSNPRGLALSGSYLVAADSGGSSVGLVNVATPGTPSVATILNIGGTPESVVAVGRYAIVSDRSSTSVLTVIDTALATPAVISTVSLATNALPRGLLVHGGWLYVGESGTGFIAAIPLGGLEATTVRGGTGLFGTLDAGHLTTRRLLADSVAIAGDLAVGGALPAHAATHALGGTDALVRYSGMQSTARVETLPRIVLAGAGLTGTSGALHLCYFSPEYSFTAHTIDIITASTATSVVTSDFALGIYAVDANDNLTSLLGYYQTITSSALSVAKTVYGGTITSDGTTPTTVALVAGTRYAFAFFWTGTGTPSVYCIQPGTAAITGLSPAMARATAGATYAAIPTSGFNIAAPSTNGNVIYGYLT